ncbi:MAG: hypothetical protein AB7V43_17330 [Acidimicrobiia bacterium]
MSITGTITDSINDSITKSTIAGNAIAESAIAGAAHLSEELGHLFTSLAETADSKLHPVSRKARWLRRWPAGFAAVTVIAVAVALYRRRRSIQRRPVETTSEASERLRSVTP